MSKKLLLAIVLLILAHAWYFVWISPVQTLGAFRRLDLLLLDMEVRYSDRPEPATKMPRPVVLGLTRRDIKDFGAFPWPRERWAEVIHRLNELGARKIVLDVFFVSKGPTAKGDEQLVEEIKKSRRVLVPVYSSILLDPNYLEGGGVFVGQIQLNDPPLQAAAAGSGHINAFLDVDKQIRFVPLFLRHKDRTYYQLSVEALRNTDQGRALIGRIQAEPSWPGILIDYRGFDNRYDLYSLGELLSGEITPDKVRDRIVFVGQTTQGLPFADMVSTPIGLRHGILVHAGICDQILSGHLVEPLRPLPMHLYFYFLCVGTVILSAVLNQRMRILAFICVPAVAFLAHLTFYQQHDLVLPITASTIAAQIPFLLAFVVSDFYFRFRTRRELKKSEKMAGIGRMAGMIAHDVRNPLAILLGQTEYLMNERPEPAQRNALESIQRQTMRIEHMLDELLEYTSGQMKIDRKETDFVAFISKLGKEIEQDFCAAKNIPVHVSVPEDKSDGRTLVDQARFRRVLENMVKNAVEMMPRGGWINLSLDDLGESWKLRIRDSGPGVDPAIATQIFEPFVTAGKQHGIGLGLAITREIIVAHGGTIELEKTRPGETIFLITLPKVKAD